MIKSENCFLSDTQTKHKMAFEVLAKPIYGLATGTAIFCIIVMLINLHIKKTALKTMVSREFGKSI